MRSGTELLSDSKAQPLVGHCGNGSLDRLMDLLNSGSLSAWYTEEACEKAHLVSSRLIYGENLRLLVDFPGIKWEATTKGLGTMNADFPIKSCDFSLVSFP